MQPSAAIGLGAKLRHEEPVGAHVNELLLTSLFDRMYVQPLHAIDFRALSLQHCPVPRPTRRVPGLWHGTGRVVAPVYPGSAACLNFAYISLHDVRITLCVM